MARKSSTKLAKGSLICRDRRYYYRCTVNGKRIEKSLKCQNRKEALEKAADMALLTEATSKELLAARVSELRAWSQKKERLELSHAWDMYNRHPNRARPATVNIYLRYGSYFADFVDWATAQKFQFIDEITDAVADSYATHLKTLQIGVDTHNKRITRIAHVFKTLSAYTTPETTDWRNPNFKRKPREENGIEARRLPFTREQEEAIFSTLADPKHKWKNQAELKVLFALGAYTGQRMKDCALLQWHSVDLKRLRISVKQFKTGKDATIPIAPQLLQLLNEAEAWKCDSYVLPGLAKRYLKKNAKGKDIGGGLVNLDVLRVIKAAGISTNTEVAGRKRAVTVYGFHSLRHAFVSFCAEQGVSKAVVVSILGADSKIIDKYYTHIGNEAQEQAIQAISGHGISTRKRLEMALEFIDGLADKTPDIIELEKILRI